MMVMDGWLMSVYPYVPASRPSGHPTCGQRRTSTSHQRCYERAEGGVCGLGDGPRDEGYTIVIMVFDFTLYVVLHARKMTQKIRYLPNNQSDHYEGKGSLAW